MVHMFVHKNPSLKLFSINQFLWTFGSSDGELPKVLWITFVDMCHMKFALCMQHHVSYLHSSAALIQENGRIIFEQDEEYERILLNDLCKQAEVWLH